MDAARTTLRTYDASARQLADYFRGIGPRIADIERALALAGVSDGTGKVVEIGCGDGRDAAEIRRRVAWYEGFDPSSGMLGLARLAVPGASFIQADALDYGYPSGLDVVLAFASLLHVPRDDLARVCLLVQLALRPGGVFYVSLKEGRGYQTQWKKDRYGERIFYLYDAELVEKLAGTGFDRAYSDRQTIGSTDWFTLALRRR